MPNSTPPRKQMVFGNFACVETASATSPNTIAKTELHVNDIKPPHNNQMKTTGKASAPYYCVMPQ